MLNNFFCVFLGLYHLENDNKTQQLSGDSLESITSQQKPTTSIQSPPVRQTAEVANVPPKRIKILVILCIQLTLLCIIYS